jgi:hypothetical protein
MDILTNTDATIQISAENFSRLKSMFEQLSAKIDMPQNKNICKNKIEQIVEEDTLDPLEPEDLDDDVKDDVKDGVKDDVKTEIVNTNDSTNNMNEIMPDDIIEEDDGTLFNNMANTTDQNIDSDLDLASEEDLPVSSQQSFHQINKPMQHPLSYGQLQTKQIPLQIHSTLTDSEIGAVSKSKMEILMENKITLNVGGKKFNLKKNLLECLGINYSRLHKITKNDRQMYFLDRDPYYFSKMISIIKLYGLDQEKIVEHIDDYSDQFVNELCYYGIIDKKYNPRPKLRLKRTVTFPSRHDEIIKIVVGDQYFETLSGVLSRSTFFDIKLKMSRKKRFFLPDVDPKLFRYVIIFLRIGELYISNVDIIELLNNYGIEFEKLEILKVNECIVSHLLPHNLESVHNQIIGCINTIDPRANIISKSNNMYQFIDNKYYYPENMLVSPSAENINIITTDSKLAFDSEIIFNLTDQKNMGECIEDLLLCIDIPVLKPTEPYEYIDMVEYQLVEYVNIITDDGTNKKLMLQTNPDLLYLYPIIYTNNANDYHSMTKIDDKKIKLLYDNTLIDIHRITIPLFLFRNKQNHLPIKKMSNNKISAAMVVKMTSIKKIFKNKIKDVPLLNICLISNFINLATGMTICNPPENNQQPTFRIIPLNYELISHPIMYIYDKFHSVSVTIQTTANPIYDIAIISLEKFGLIKDFFFTIVEKDDLVANRFDKFSDQLIELEILQMKENPQTQQKTLILHSKFDSTILNNYVPIKQLGHRLPTGIYYYSFTADPKSNQIFGGLMGIGNVVRIKVKKMNGIIKFYANEYYREIF